MVVLAAGLYLGRASLLRTLGAGLVVDEALAPSTCLLILDGDWRHRIAGEWYRKGRVKQVLVIETRPNRLEAMGLLPARAKRERRALLTQGVPDSAITIIPGQARNDWQQIHVLKCWLEEHPLAEVHLVCPLFQSRNLSFICGRVLGEAATRAHMLPVPSRDYDVRSWWQEKEGLLDFLTGALCLTHNLVLGERAVPWNDWDPDAYEASLR